MSIKESDMVTSPRSPDYLGVVPVAGDGHGPADPWLRIDDRGVSGLPLAGQAGRSLSIRMRHQAAWFLCGATSVSMVAGGWLIQTLAGSRGGLGGCRNLPGRAA